VVVLVAGYGCWMVLLDDNDDADCSTRSNVDS
jgi:hypothetical protein